MDSVGRTGDSSGAKAQFLLGLNVGAKAPTPGATIYEMASREPLWSALAHRRIATDGKLGCNVAIKVLLARTASDPKRISASGTCGSSTS